MPQTGLGRPGSTLTYAWGNFSVHLCVVPWKDWPAAVQEPACKPAYSVVHVCVSHICTYLLLSKQSAKAGGMEVRIAASERSRRHSLKKTYFRNIAQFPVGWIRGRWNCTQTYAVRQAHRKLTRRRRIIFYRMETIAILEPQCQKWIVLNLLTLMAAGDWVCQFALLHFELHWRCWGNLLPTDGYNSQIAAKHYWIRLFFFLSLVAGITCMHSQ